MVAVYVSGVWDLFHIGHLRVLQKAKQIGDILVVGVLTDELTASYKDKPIIPYEQRKEIINGLKGIDIVIAHPYLNYTEMAGNYNITIRVVGPEFGVLEGQREFLEYAQAHNIEVIVMPNTPNISTTKIKEKIKNE